MIENFHGLRAGFVRFEIEAKGPNIFGTYFKREISQLELML
jgi:hypothetical protein